MSGEEDWYSWSYDVPAGSYVLRWVYAKSPSGVDGSDCGWLDQVVWSGASTWDTGHQDLGSNWRRLDWFGDYVPTGNGWFWHDRHGYFFPTDASTPASIYLYTMDMGWLFTHQNRYPYLYRFSDQSWLWYMPGSQNPRWFNNLTSGQWEAR